MGNSENTDPKTIEMILMKIWGFSVKEISEYLNLPEKLFILELTG